MEPIAPSESSRPRVFVSSVVDGFELFREAARRAVVEAGGKPVLVNEDFPAQAASSRNVCLDAVDSCDVHLVIVGERGGWTTPSGRLVVDEEYERAKAKGLPILVFVQDVAQRDAAAQTFCDKMSAYVAGHFRRRFASASGLEQEIRSALSQALPTLRRTAVDPRVVADALKAPFDIHNEAVLRVVLAPERDEEVVPPTRIGQPEFENLLLRIGHENGVALFDFTRAKRTQLEGPRQVVRQEDQRGRPDGTKEVQLTIAESGLVTIDANVSNRDLRDHQGGLDMMFVTNAVAREAIAAAFAFAARLYEELDPYVRHGRFAYNVMLHKLDFRSFVDHGKRTASGGVPMRMGGDAPIIAYDAPRPIARQGLVSARDEIDRAIAVLAQKASS